MQQEILQWLINRILIIMVFFFYFKLQKFKSLDGNGHTRAKCLNGILIQGLGKCGLA